MANLFDSANYPEIEPESLVLGDSWLWKRSDLGSDYPPASYALTYDARLHGDGTTSISITANEDGSDYLVEVAAATTVNYTAGTYSWRAFITRTSDSARVQVGSGTWEVKPDPATDTDDPRSHVKKTLDALQATILGKASLDQLSYTIGDRQLSRMTAEDLIEWEKYYKQLYQKELDAEAAANGKSAGRTIYLKL